MLWGIFIYSSPAISHTLLVHTNYAHQTVWGQSNLAAPLPLPSPLLYPQCWKSGTSLCGFQAVVVLLKNSLSFWPVLICQVIVEKVSGSQIVDIDKRKYLVPSDITVAQFMWIIRKRIQLPSEKAIFLFVDKTVPQSSLTMGQLYEKEKDEDGFLYVAYSGENTFGFWALAGLGAPFLLVYPVNNWLFSVTPPEPPHRPTSAFVTGFIS